MDQLDELKAKAKHVLEPASWEEIADMLFNNPQHWILVTREGTDANVAWLHQYGIRTIAEPYGVAADGTILITIWAIWPEIGGFK